MEAELFITADREFQTTSDVCFINYSHICIIWIGNWSLLKANRVLVDWSISEYELVDEDEAGQVDKPYVLFSFFTCDQSGAQW